MLLIPISSPACYGKLPFLGDFYQAGAGRDETAVWAGRFDSFWETAGADIRPGSDPWCFTLAPEVLFPGRHYIVGVMTVSEDRVGRPYPFVIWQKVADRALRRSKLFGGPGERHNWLFWLSRFLLIHSRADNDSAAKTLRGFELELAALWKGCRQNWWAQFRRWSRRPGGGEPRYLLRALPESDLEGTHFLPFNDWPDRLWTKQPAAYFWRQDHQGLYLDLVQSRKLTGDIMIRLFSGGKDGP